MKLGALYSHQLVMATWVDNFHGTLKKPKMRPKPIVMECGGGDELPVF